MKAIVLIAAVLLPISNVLAGSYVYISVAGENKIAIYEMETSSGKLAHKSDVAVDGSPGSMAVSPDRRFLFAALRSTGKIASFRIDPQTGSLSPISTTNVGASAAYVSTDRTGKFLLSAYYQAGKVGVHAIDEKGALSREAKQWVETAERAHAILADHSNRFVFVPHTGPNAVFQFQFDEKTGSLTANSPAKLNTPEGTEPRHLWFHPNERFVYLDNEKGSSVTACTFNAQSGTLTPFQTISTLPQGFSESNSCADIELTSSGRYLYSSNRGHNSIACFAVDPNTGRLTTIEQAPTEEVPRSFNVDPTENFLYAAGQRSGKLAAYRINSATGRLTRFETYTVGKNPSWVQVVRTTE